MLFWVAHYSVRCSEVVQFSPGYVLNLGGKGGNLGPEFPVLLSPLCQVAGKVGHIQNSPLAM